MTTEKEIKAVIEALSKDPMKELAASLWDEIIHFKATEISIAAALRAAYRIGLDAADLDAERYRWLRDCEPARRVEITGLAGLTPDLMDHHIDKGMCGL